MKSDRLFINALMVSVLFHALLFLNKTPLRDAPILKKPNRIEVTYYHLARQTPPVSGLIAQRDKGSGRPAPPAARASQPVSKENAMAKPMFDLKADKPHIKSIEIEADNPVKRAPSQKSIQKSMFISYAEKDFSNEPVYLSYYNAVRAKIYKIANTEKPYNFMEGDVRLIFTLSRDGTLVKADIIDEGSTTNPILRNHALMSIKKAAPFPPFHESIKEGELILRQTISFEKEK